MEYSKRNSIRFIVKKKKKNFFFGHMRFFAKKVKLQMVYYDLRVNAGFFEKSTTWARLGIAMTVDRAGFLLEFSNSLRRGIKGK